MTSSESRSAGGRGGAVPDAATGGGPSLAATARATGWEEGESTTLGAGEGHGRPGSAARTALDYAYAQVGKPYQWGGAGPDSFDSSGLTMRAWGAAGVSLPRTVRGQAEAGRRIPRDALRSGDLVFFGDDVSHVGMYAGGGQMVHVPRDGRQVEVVSMAGYWEGRFRFGLRP